MFIIFIKAIKYKQLYLPIQLNPPIPQRNRKTLRIAAYCRVSTDDIDQAISIELQMRQYKEKIKSNPDWKYAGTYVDNGFSGTNTAHRPGFLKLIEDARAGKSC